MTYSERQWKLTNRLYSRWKDKRRAHPNPPPQTPLRRMVRKPQTHGVPYQLPPLQKLMISCEPNPLCNPPRMNRKMKHRTILTFTTKEIRHGR
jgi:hypothetical protein